MSRLIDAEKYRKEFLDSRDFEPMKILDFQPTVKAISLDKLKKAMEQIIDEKDFAYADFDEYKREVLEVEDTDDLPDDDFRYGMERCLEILNVLIAESEDKK